MDHNTQYASQQAQALQTQTNSQLVKLVAELMKRYSDKKQQDHRIEIKVDGKVKFKGTVDKNGKLSVTKNTLTAAETQALKSYFSAIPIAPAPELKSAHPKDALKSDVKEPIQRADFDVQINGKTVLKTEDGKIQEAAKPNTTTKQAQTKSAKTESVNSINQKTTIQSKATKLDPPKTKAGPKP